MRVYYDNSGTWTRVSGIVDFPNISSRRDVYGFCIVKIRDFEGALYDTWYDRDFTEMLITDDADTLPEDCNTIFRGFLKNKKFHDKDLILEIHGVGELLERKSFGHEEEINFSMAEGKIDTCNASSIIDVYSDLDDDDTVDLPEEAFTWDVDYWTNLNVGLMIVDNTSGYSSKTWNSSAVAVANEEAGAGVNADITTFNDDDQLWATDTSTTPDLTITATMDDGVVVPAGSKIKKIEIRYRFAFTVAGNALDTTSATMELQILKGASDWQKVDSSYLSQYGVNPKSSGWISAMPTSQDGSTKQPFIVPYNDHDNLADFLDLDGADYGSLKGLRFKITDGSFAGLTAYGSISVDFIQTIIHYHTTVDVDDVMVPITGNTATTLTSSSVADWSVLGITEKTDAFQIGTSTHTVLKYIASEAGLDIDIIDNFSGTPISVSGRYPTGDTATIEWTTTDGGGVHYTEINGTNDATYVDTAINAEEDIYTFDTVSLNGGYVSTIKIYHRQKCDVINKEVVGISYSTDGGTTWSSVKSDDLTVNWVTEDSSWTSLEIYDMSNFQVKILYTQIFAGSSAYVSKLYCDFTIKPSDFNKYMARKFKGYHCIDALRAVCDLEGAHWVDVYAHNKKGIKVLKAANYEDSGITLTQSNYTHDWEIEDKCNQIKAVYVWGKSSYNKDTKKTNNIFAKAISSEAEGDRSIQITDDSIMSQAEAKTIADTQLALHEFKRPSIRIPLKGVNTALQLGTTVELLTARPTVYGQKKWSDTVAGVAGDVITMTETFRTHTTNQYANWYVVVDSGDNAGTTYRVLSNTNAQPTAITLTTTPPADLATDVISMYDPDYPIRMIERRQLGITEIETIIHCGMGSTKWDEKFFRTFNQLISDVHRLSHNKLTSTPYETGTGGLTWGSIAGADAGADARIVVQNTHPAGTIDVAIDALIATHAATPHAVMTEAQLFTQEVIGSANKVWKTPIYQGESTIAPQWEHAGTLHRNSYAGAGRNDYHHWECDLPMSKVIKGVTYWLNINALKIRVVDADAGDYINQVFANGSVLSDGSSNAVINDGNPGVGATNITAAGEYDIAVTPFDCNNAGDPYIQLYFSTYQHTTGNRDLDINNFRYEYYYDTV